MEQISNEEKVHPGKETSIRRNYLAQEKPQRKHLYYSAISANLLYVSLGCAVAWPSSAIPMLKSRGIRSDQITWMVSILMLGSCFGPTLYYCCIDRFGRKCSLLLTGVCYVFSWLIIGITDDIYSLYIGRFIAGLGVGSTLNCIPVYISEISDVELRQTLTSLTELFISLGCFISYATGPWLTYRTFVLVSVLPSLFFGLATARNPESPYHLISKGKKQQAFETLIWLRGPTSTVTDELAQIEHSVMRSQMEAGKTFDIFKKRGPRKALWVSCLMLFFLPFAATDVVVSYLGPIFQDTSLPFSPEMATVIVGFIQVIFGAFEPLVVYKFGSKWTMIVCSFCCSFFLLSFGIYKFFDERNFDLTSFTAVPIVCLVLFQIFFVLGVGALSWSISVELFPPSVKGIGIGLVTTMNWIVDFVVVTAYGDLSPIVGVSSCFIFFSSVLTVGTILIAIIVPNTKGIALNTIHDNLQN